MHCIPLIFAGTPSTTHRPPSTATSSAGAAYSPLHLFYQQVLCPKYFDFFKQTQLHDFEVSNTAQIYFRMPVFIPPSRLKKKWFKCDRDNLTTLNLEIQVSHKDEMDFVRKMVKRSFWLDGKLHTLWYAVLCINLYVGHQKHLGSFMRDKCDRACNTLLQDVLFKTSNLLSSGKSPKDRIKVSSWLKYHWRNMKQWRLKGKGTFSWLAG